MSGKPQTIPDTFLESALRKANQALLLSSIHQQELTEEARASEERAHSTERKSHEAWEFVDAILRTSPVPLLVLDKDLRVVGANDAFYAKFHMQPGETSGRLVYELGRGQWNIPDLRKLLEDILPHQTWFEHFEVTHDFPAIGRRTMLLNARQMAPTDGGSQRIILVIEDVTERNRADESRARLAAIVESSADAMISKSLDGTIQSWNAGAEKLFGYAAAEVVGRSIRLLIPPDRQYEEEIILEKIGRGEAVRHYETVRIAKDGRQIDISLTVSPVRDGSGRIIGASKVARDITEQKQAEARLRESQERLAAELADAQLLQGVSAALIEQENVEKLYEKIVDAAAGIMRSEFASMQMLYPERGSGGELKLLAFRGFNPEAAKFWQWVRADSQSTCGEALRTGRRAIATDVETCAYMAGSEDLATYLKTGIRAVQTTPLLSRRGKIVGMISTHWRQPHAPSERELRLLDILARQAADLIERNSAIETLRLSEQRFSRFMQNLPGLAWIKDAQGRYVYANDAALKVFLRAGGELYGRTDEELFPREIAAQFQANDQRALASSTGVQVEETMEQQDGTLHYSLVSKFPIPGADGNPAFIGGMALDITDLKLAEQVLRDADRRKNDFLATLAHELRNPLAPIRNSLHLLKMSSGKDSLARIQEMMERQVSHMVRLVDDLLEVSRISRGKVELRKERVELAQIVSSAVETSRPLIESYRHQLSTSLPGESVVLHADPVRLAQVIANLLNNAAKYTDKGGHIWLSARVQGPQVELSVRDTGIGIAPELLPRVFEMFTQLDRSARPESESGLGIGLSLVRNLTELHGGTVEARSAGVGQGSEFIVRLPLARR